MLRSFLPLALGLLALPLAFQAQLEPNHQNLAAERLAGTWEADPVVGERLGTDARATRIEFVPDPQVAQRIPAKHSAFLRELTLFESGIVTWFQADQAQYVGPYLLTSLHGNPCLITFREAEGEPLGDAESAYILLAPGKQPSQDLLLFGGDFDNEPMRAFRRMVVSEEQAEQSK